MTNSTNSIVALARKIRRSPSAIVIKRFWNQLLELEKIVLYLILDLIVISQRRPVTPRTLLLVRLDGIGDYVLFRNFIEVLKNSDRFRDYEITLCGNETYKDFAETYDHQVVTDFIWINRKSFGRNFAYRCRKLKEINRKGFEVVINPVYSRESLNGDSVVRAAGSKERIGCAGDLVHARRWERKVFDRYYTQLIRIGPAIVFEFYKTKEFFETILSTKITLHAPSLPYRNAQKKATQYAIICPGALYVEKRWPLEKFIQVIDYLHTKFGLVSTLVGDIYDLPSDHTIHLLAERPYVTNFIGTVSLTQTTAIIQDAALVISNDTSVAHIGVAANRPVIVLSNGQRYGRFTEYPKEIYQYIYYAYPPEIATTILSFDELVKKFQYGSRLDIKAIEVETVFRLIDKALSL